MQSYLDQVNHKILEQIQVMKLQILPTQQSLNSVESAKTVITEEPEKKIFTAK